MCTRWDRIKISTVVDELAKLANANLDSQHDNRAAIPPMNYEDTDAVSEVISSARELLGRLQGSTDRRDAALSLYISLLESLEEVKEQVGGNPPTKCWTEFCRLISDANVSTLKLQDTDESLITYAETTMRYYALDRRLNKLCEAFSIA
ncbi:hypothetical protein JG687_00007558 [Phytophthora cactorum]|uniref:Uncharacterized protein n=1 Tax=Phytophthora cactorum TaxID=29920 RepID=A0A8T1UJY7_9STRA|nr:hypothetical protein JG687_00007558 [Phytophthora cactorum]